jgi:hypothetical protein
MNGDHYKLTHYFKENPGYSEPINHLPASYMCHLPASYMCLLRAAIKRDIGLVGELLSSTSLGPCAESGTGSGMSIENTALSFTAPVQADTGEGATTGGGPLTEAAPAAIIAFARASEIWGAGGTALDSLGGPHCCL